MTPQQIRVILSLFVGNVIEATTKRKVFKVMEDICFIEIVLVCDDVFQIAILDAFAAHTVKLIVFYVLGCSLPPLLFQEMPL